MGTGGFMRDSRLESVVRNVILFEVTKKPEAFALIGIECDIDPAGVIETQRPVDRSLSIGADRNRLAECDLIGSGELVKLIAGKNAVSVIVRKEFAVPFGMNFRVGFLFDERPQQCHLLDEAG